jgi:hypothetical protein
MGGSGSRGGFFKHTKPEELQAAIRQQEEKTKDQAFETEVATELGSIVSDYNQRDSSKISSSIDQIKRALTREIEGSIDSLYGGSVRKHTYVDGISDVDALLILRDPQLQSMSPQEVLEYFERRLNEALKSWEISRGKLSVKLTKGDLQIQILPAIRKDGMTKIPSPAGDTWSEINPEAFFRQLTRANDRTANKLVPVIKAVKIVNAKQPEALQLTGYHIESLAIEAFKNYGGLTNPKAMLEHFYDRARNLVLTPIRDRSGQSVHVDEYLGPANSQSRKAVSSALDRVLRQMKNANAQRSKEPWLDLFADE